MRRVTAQRVCGVPFPGETLNVGSGKLENRPIQHSRMSDSPIMSAAITGADE